MTHITRTQMIQLQSHYTNGKTVEELATMIGDTPNRIIALLGDVYNAPEATDPVDPMEPVATAKEENWED